MSWLGRFTRQLGLGGNAATNSRGIARERLSIILAHQRGEILLEGIDMKRLQGEVLECVKVSSLISVDGMLPVLELECLATSLNISRIHSTLTARVGCR